MIDVGWWVVLQSQEVGSTPLAARRFGHDLVFWRDGDGAVVAQDDRCPHRLARLSTGRVVDGCIECPFHGFRFDPDGSCTEIPAHPERRIPRAMRVRSWPTREAHGFVWVWPDETSEPTAELPWFEDLDDTWSVAGLEATWDADLGRCIENQLDYTHLAFVHKSTIGRFAGKSPGFEVVEDEVAGSHRIRFGVPDAAEWGIEWREPNVWVNRISANNRITLAFVPIDAGRTKYYLQNWQKQVTVPGLAWLWQKLAMAANRYILAEDRAVVEGQTPSVDRLDAEEILVPSDGPVLMFRTLRERRRRELAARRSRGAASHDEPAGSPANPIELGRGSDQRAS